MTASAAKLVETYPGLASFQDTANDRKLFCGRTTESNLLFNLVASESLSILYSRSGFGKTSLINAGLLQRLRDHGYVSVVARVSDYPQDPSRSVIETLKRKIPDVAGDESGLWEYLNSVQVMRKSAPAKLVLILDQFEELFARVNVEQQVAFIDELANIVRHRLPDRLRRKTKEALDEIDAATIEQARTIDEHRTIDDIDLTTECSDPPRRRELVEILYGRSSPDVNVLISMREDYLAELERLRTSVPNVFQSMLRLEPLGVKAAAEAIVEPAAVKLEGKDVFAWEEQAVNVVVMFLSKMKVQDEYVASDLIDPGQLQLICREVDRRRQRAGTKIITVDDLGGERGMQRILTQFYRNVVHKVPSVRLGWDACRWKPSLHNLLFLNLPRMAVYTLCESGLIVRGSRNSLTRDAIERDYGVTEPNLRTLVNEKLVRVIPRADRDLYELSHDTLVRPIRNVVRGRRRRMYALLAALSLLLLVLILGVANQHSLREAKLDWEKQKSEQDLLDQLGRVARSRSQFPQTKDLARADLTSSLLDQKDLTSGNLTETNLSRSTIWRCQLNEATAQNARFTGATILSSDLSGLRGAAADFTGAQLLRSKLIGANLGRANFSTAIIRECDFSGADLSGANFNGVDCRTSTFKGAKTISTTFEGTPWWIAENWLPEQWSDLKRRYPKERLPLSQYYQKQLEALTQAIDEAGAGVERSAALNERAWFRAVRGCELRTALKDASDGLKIAPSSPFLLDTRGYIEIQMGQLREALNDCRASVRGAQAEVGEASYHLALACEAAGQEECATEQFAAAEKKNYVPSYELMLTPRVSSRHPRPSQPAP
jgi:uncharacterized protein YjbI with pentapeptide repeats